MIGGAKGIGIGIDFGIPNQYCRATSKPYIEKDVLDSLRVVASAYGKSNDDADRSIVKNLVDASNPFIISNAAFKLNSGFGEYKEDFTSWRIYPNIKVTDNVITTNGNFNSTWFIYKHSSESKINEMNIKVSGIPKGGKILYFYISDETANLPIAYTIPKDGIYHLPESKINNNRASVGFTVESSYDWNNIRIEQIPSFEGAFVTDGIDDLITSTKTVQEMLGGSNEITVVSMIHQVKDSSNNVSFTNYIRGSANGYFRNIVNNYDKTGIYGYTSSDLMGLSVVNNILGDKNDYTSNGDNRDSIINGNFSVQGYSYNDGNNTGDFSSVAWYWTVIANKVLTTDQINQVIAYFNLDRTLKPDILCDVKKQGITNDNHAEFGDKLIDYSGNGRYIQLNNLAWDGDSGIGKYNYPNWKVNVTQGNKYARIVYYDSINGTYSANFKGITDLYKSYGLSIEIRVNRANTVDFHSIKEDGIYTITPPDDTTSIDIRFGGENVYNASCDITITQIPSHAGALLLDGVDDFGKVTGMPVYKDYTVVTDREIFANTGAISSKNNPGAFVETAGNSVYSFGQATYGLNFISTRSISYLSKYSYCGQSITAGAAEDGTDMWLGTIRDNDSRFFNGAIYSLMSFPYSMSEFLIERQLKKHKLGTLYPDMVEFRPIVKSNVKWNIIEIWQGDKSLYRPAINDDKTGIYLKKDSTIGIYVKPKDADEVTKIVVNGTEYTNLKINSNGFYYVTLPITKSPQKINITIDEYIRYEDIVQPYPSFVKLENLDRTYTYTWGDKLKVGDTIRYNSSVNLLEGAYTLKGQLECNGVYVYDNNQHITVAKEMIFAWTNNPVWSIDNNEPKCILSPRLLRIPNSSYKILGHIPDISGHGNHGKINNSAYAEGSGVNADGSYQFDGVDDFVTIPTLSSGGKQVLMKINWQSGNGDVLYDQRTSTEGLFAITAASETIAYNYRNAGGNTYIDGVLNKHILSEELASITHNIILNNDYTVTNSNIFIGTNYANTVYAKMSLYDFMLFDNISTDDKIKELNEYVGIEAKVELPPYYWDAYGKTNSDADRDTIQQRGIAVGDYDLTNYNHAYEGMSGYNGYPVVFGANKTWANESNGYVTSITSNTIHITNVLNAGLSLLYSYVKYNGNLQNIKEIPPFKIEIKGLEGRSKLIYKYLATSDATKETNLYLGNGTHELPKSFLPTEALVNNAVVGFSISPIEIGVTNFLSDITIEVLPEYENGLAYDGVEDYSENVNIPIVDDFTFLVKASLLKGFTGSGGLIARKGDVKHVTSGGYAFVYCLDSSSNEANRNSYYSFGKALLPSTGAIDPPLIGYMTKTSVNGVATKFGTNPDIKGINFGDWNGGRMSMVVYKSILYPKTIPLLQINFLKNLMEKDEIIDLTNPIFIQ